MSKKFSPNITTYAAVLSAFIASATLSFQVASAFHNHLLYKKEKASSIKCSAKVNPRNKHSELRCKNLGNGSANIKSVNLYYKGKKIENTTRSIKKILPKEISFEVNPIQAGTSLKANEEIILIKSTGKNSIDTSKAIFKFLTETTLELRYYSQANECNEKMLGVPREKTLSCTNSFSKYFQLAVTSIKNWQF